MGSLVGRAVEVARFGELLNEVQEAAGRVVALPGAAGSGKSRLAAEFLALAQRRGFRGLTGTACAYQGDLSYAPVVEALRPLVEEPLTAGLTDLGRLFDGLPTPPPPALGDPGLERTRLSEAIAQLLRRAAEQRPTVILIDDLHWADSSSVDALHYLGRAVTQIRCLLLLTYRPNEAPTGLRTMLTSLRRGEWLVEVPVGPLSREGVAALASDVLGDQAPGPLLDVLTKAGGMPLFVRELTIALRDDGRLFRSGGRWVLGPDAAGTVPESVVELFEQRIEGLDRADRAVLEAVSICADAATFALVGKVCADAPGERLDRLQEAGQVIDDVSGGEVVYRPAHPLLGEAVYARLSARARQELHAVVAAAIDPADVSRLAHHVARAGTAVEPARALTTLCAAAEHAVASRAGEEGAQHARGAIELADRLGRTDLTPRLLELLAQSAFYAGRIEDAMQAWRHAASARTGEARARCLLQLAQLETDEGELTEARNHLDQALAALGDMEATETRLDIAEAGLILHTRAGAEQAVSAVVDELARIASLSEHPRARALVRYSKVELRGYGMVPVDEVEADAAIDEVAAVAGLPLVACLQRISMGSAAGRGEHAVVTRRAQRSLELARDAGLPMIEVIPTAFWGFARFDAGAWDGALGLSDRTLALAHRVGMPWGIALALALRAMVLVHRGALEEAESCTAEARAAYRLRRGGRLLDVIDAQIALARGDAERAIRIAPRDGPFAFPVLTLRVRAEACLRAGDRAEAKRTAEELERLGFPYAVTTAQRLRGVLAGPQGTSRIEEAVAALDKLAIPFDAALYRLDLAEATDHPDDAIKVATKAMAVFDDLEAAPAADRARRLLRELGVRPKLARRRPGELSSRESEVASLVAQGLSNVAVAQRLFLSPRTVTTHLDNIYRRLGLSSRAELARHLADQEGPS